MPKRISLVGRIFGKLKVIADAPTLVHKGKHRGRSLCLCECGKESIRINSDLIGEHTRSCGCLVVGAAVKHGHSVGSRPSRTYESWGNLIQRCTNPKHPRYHDYGGRGITVCEKWIDSFDAFLKDMGDCPPELTIERIDNNRGYEPGNCKWATRAEQHQNRRDNKILTVRGITLPFTTLCKHFGVPFPRTRSRLLRGWNLEEAFFTPKTHRFLSRQPLRAGTD